MADIPPPPSPVRSIPPFFGGDAQLKSRLWLRITDSC